MVSLNHDLGFPKFEILLNMYSLSGRKNGPNVKKYISQMTKNWTSGQVQLSDERQLKQAILLSKISPVIERINGDKAPSFSSYIIRN